MLGELSLYGKEDHTTIISSLQGLQVPCVLFGLQLGEM
jgi:hypothetical protein